MRYLLAVLHLGGWIAGWLFVLLFAGWATRDLAIETVDDEPLIAVSTWREWVSKVWRYSTTIGRGIIFQPHARTDRRIRRHEATHVRQSVDRSVLAFLVGVGLGISSPAAGLAFWLSGWLWQLPNFLTAAMRFGIRNAYRDSEHERSAYAQTDLGLDGNSWADLRDDARANPEAARRRDIVHAVDCDLDDDCSCGADR